VTYDPADVRSGPPNICLFHVINPFPHCINVNLMASVRLQIIQVYSTTDLAIQTGKIKCEKAISIVDCSCIAIAKPANAKAVFARKEKELAREIERKPFDVEITFLEK